MQRTFLPNSISRCAWNRHIPPLGSLDAVDALSRPHSHLVNHPLGDIFGAQRRGASICTCLPFHPMTPKSSFCHRSTRNAAVGPMDPTDKRLHDVVALSRSRTSTSSRHSRASDAHPHRPPRFPTVALAETTTSASSSRRNSSARKEGRKEGSHASSSIVSFHRNHVPRLAKPR